MERAEEDVDVFRDDLSRLIDEVPGSSSEQNDQRMLEITTQRFKLSSLSKV